MSRFTVTQSTNPYLPKGFSSEIYLKNGVLVYTDKDGDASLYSYVASLVKEGNISVIIEADKYEEGEMIKATLSNAVVGSVLLYKPTSGKSHCWTQGKQYVVVANDGKYATLVNDNGESHSLSLALDYFEVVSVPEKPKFKKGDKVVITRASQPKYWYSSQIGEVVTLTSPYTELSLEGAWSIEEYPRNFIIEDDIELYVEEKPKALAYPNVFYVRYTVGDPLYMKIVRLANTDLWGEADSGEWVWTEKDVTRLLYEDRFWEMSTEEAYLKYIGNHDALTLSYFNTYQMIEDIKWLRAGMSKKDKTLESIQLYIRNTNVDVDVVVKADGFVVIDSDSNEYECDDELDKSLLD